MDFAVHVDELAPAVPLPFDPLPDVVVAVLVDVTAISVVQVSLELAFVDDLVDLLAHALHATIVTDLSDNEPVILRAAKRQ